MSDERPLKVVLCWHMHQPEYRNMRSGEYQLPWTYLHGIKDYVDMVAHLEAVPEAHVVVNFTPILLEQIDDYSRQISAYLQGNGVIKDPLLCALVDPALPTERERRMALIKDCLRANEQHLIKRFKVYQHLAAMGHWLDENHSALMYIDNQYLADLLVWYHLAWMGETVRRSDIRIRRLIEKGSGFTFEDRRTLLEVIGELLATVFSRYRVLAERGQIELSVTPYAHPIVPLLLDLQSATEAMPDASLPLCSDYPGGEERVRWHIRHGLDVFQRIFGFTPLGCWPSEGSVSEATVKILSECGFQWTASGGNVLRNSLERFVPEYLEQDGNSVHKAFRLQGADIQCFFRDDGLSDLIGFTYSDWHADDAVANLLHHIENIGKPHSSKADQVVSIILDGENPWEHYPQNGYYFLQALYRGLCHHPNLEMTTYSSILARGMEAVELPHLVAGSWVYGTFSTWIGHKDKNRGWDMLGEAKNCFDRVVRSGRLRDDQLTKVEHQLAICEGSDWFWWFGDYNSAESVSNFERLYRRNLTSLYMMLGERPPAYLTEVFTHGSGAPVKGGTMRPGRETD
jgi:alpha-amylase/alpha-mannosidase (GH57 family)